VTFEEGAHAARLYDTLQRAKVKVVVCDPRKNRLPQDGNKSDKVDARKLAQLLRAGLLSPVYHGEHGTRDLKELVRVYEYRVEDSARTMDRIKALYRSRAIACSGTDVYKPRRREGRLAKLPGLAHAREPNGSYPTLGVGRLVRKYIDTPRFARIIRERLGREYSRSGKVLPYSLKAARDADHRRNSLFQMIL
jgi:Transposase